jgi:hypothetical protein
MFAGVSHPGPAVGVVLAASIVIPGFVPAIMPSISDPTQVTASDLAIRLDVTCSPSRTDPTMLGVTATATLTWARHDALPAGLLGTLDGPRDRDAVVVGAVWGTDRPTTDEAPTWALADRPSAEPWLEPGFLWGAPADATVSLAGGPPDLWTSQAWADAASMNDTASVVSERMEAGQPYRVTWHLLQRGPMPWPAVRVRYVHEYRFAVEATAGCGETVDGVRAG